MVAIVGGNRQRYTRAQILAAFPPLQQKIAAAKGNGHTVSGEAFRELVRQVLTGEHLHPALLAIAFRQISANVPGGQVVEYLRGIMLAMPEQERDERWRARFAEIPGLVESAEKKQQESAETATTSARVWPIMDARAMHGIVGEVARLATANSEADAVAVVATTLAYAAAEFGRAQYVHIGDNIHHSRHFNAVVGKSSRARKGTSYAPVRRIFEEAEAIRRAPVTLMFPSGSKLQISIGPLSSGEGLVYAVRDGSDDDEDDPGVKDKRLLVVEQELGAALRAFQRKGNNLSMILRMAFDGGTIAPLTKNNRLVATNPHINLVGHITHHELDSLLSGIEIWNGFGNRFQWLMARRPKVVAFPQPMPGDKVKNIAQKLAQVIRQAHEYDRRELVLSTSAQARWEEVYPELTKDYPAFSVRLRLDRKRTRGVWP